MKTQQPSRHPGGNPVLAGASRRALLTLGVVLLLGGAAVGCQSDPDSAVRVDREATEQSGDRAVSDGAPPAGDGAAGERAEEYPGEPAKEHPDELAVEQGADSAEQPSESEAAPGTELRPADTQLRTDPLPTSRFVEFGRIAMAEQGDDVGNSRFEGAEGFEPPEDSERDAVLRGRRDAPLIEGDFEGGVRGFDVLVEEILQAVDDEDYQALTHLRISGYEYQRYCWPEFPHSRPVTNIPVDESWFFLERRCHSGINHGLHEWGAQALTPVRVEFRDGRADYRNFTMWKGMVIYAKRPGSSEEVPIDFAEVAIERNGLWKVYAFKD